MNISIGLLAQVFPIELLRRWGSLRAMRKSTLYASVHKASRSAL